MVAVALVVVAIGACDLLGNAYNCGYQAGYGVVDATLNAGEELAEEEKAWDDACSPPEHVDRATQTSGDNTCLDQYTVETSFLVCRDPGEKARSSTARPGSGCREFNKGTDPVFDKSDFTCPAGVPDATVCLCCQSLPENSCALAGDSCSDSSACCSGSCATETTDAGLAGTCD